jgi:hypothetical protein
VLAQFGVAHLQAQLQEANVATDTRETILQLSPASAEMYAVFVVATGEDQHHLLLRRIGQWALVEIDAGDGPFRTVDGMCLDPHTGENLIQAPDGWGFLGYTEYGNVEVMTTHERWWKGWAQNKAPEVWASRVKVAQNLGGIDPRSV